MKVIIAGSRTVKEAKVVFEAIEASGLAKVITEVISGRCHGPDTFGESWATTHHIPIKQFPADFDRYGPKAGPMRNRAMAEYAGRMSALIAVWDGKSRGTANMIEEARKNDLLVYIHKVAT